MSGPELLLLVGAGLCGGLAGSIAGLASLFSYPALLAVGLGPIAANVTNTVALVGVGAGSALGSRPELEGQAVRVRRARRRRGAGRARGGGPAAAHAVGHVRADRAMADRRRLADDPAAAARREPATEAATIAPGPGLLAGVFLIGIYGGYFGAAAGVMLLALLLAADATRRSRAATRSRTSCWRW